MFNKIKEFFTGKKTESKFAHPLDAVTTPYKVEPLVTGTYDVPPAPGVTTLLYVPPAAPSQVAVVNADEGSATQTESVKKPRKPRAPKAAPAAAVKEKAPAKAKAPKAAAKSEKA
jgi:hypothetical protein